MPEIRYTEFEKHIVEAKASSFSPIYLIHGEEVLYKKAFNTLIAALLPGDSKQLNHEPVENDNVAEALGRLNTFSLISGRKVISLSDSRIFDSTQDASAILEKAKDAYGQKKVKKAAQYFSSFLVLSNIKLEEAQNDPGSIPELKADGGKWLNEVIAYCVQNGVASSKAGGDQALELQKNIEAGFCEDNYLIITTDLIDRRRVLYKSMEKHGKIIDCSVPKGNRYADKKQQEAIIREQMQAVLSKARKTIDPAAFKMMVEMIGFDLRTFSANLEKLVSFTGARNRITGDDVSNVLKKTRQEPIYELTGALTDKNTADALVLINSLANTGFHPLQMIQAMIGQIRKLLVVKEFVTFSKNRVWVGGMPYQSFNNNVLPAVIKYDEKLLNQLQAWKGEEEEPEKQKGVKKKKKKPQKPSSDLLIAKNPRNPYPVYQMFVKSEKFTLKELQEAVKILGNADIQMKSTGKDQRQIVEEVVLRICKPVSRRRGR
ncbi:hypothetical protein QUF76_05540 [Desulfobacterales bacterium HSG16]|nr:hypothetical protein [Desulfobacterales bacterium HSG16]